MVGKCLSSVDSLQGQKEKTIVMNMAAITFSLSHLKDISFYRRLCRLMRLVFLNIKSKLWSFLLIGVQGSSVRKPGRAH